MHEQHIQTVKKYSDIIAIATGLLSLFASILFPDRIACIKWLQYLSATLGLLYIAYGGYLWTCRRVEFDWRLIHGHFLRKVVCLVILMPFVLTVFVSLFGPDSFIAEKLLLDSPEGEPSLLWSVYIHFMDGGNQNMASTSGTRGIAALVAILGVFLLNGLLVSSIVGWVDKRKDNWQNGDFRYRNVKFLGKGRFAVVIGANEIAASVIQNLFSKKAEGEINFKCEGENDYVILLTCGDVQQVRDEISSHLTDEELSRVVIYKGLRDSYTEIDELHLEHATEIYVLGESTMADGGETCHDALNMRCVNLIAKRLSECRSKRKVCKVMFEYQTTSSIFQFSDISNLVKETLIFIPFNRYDSWARKVIVDTVCKNGERVIEYVPLDGDGIAQDSSEFVHLVIVGMSKIGIALGVQALLQAHYLNSDKARTRITFIDKNAESEMAFFKGRYSNLFELVRTRYIDSNVSPSGKSIYASNWTDPIECANSKWSHLSWEGKNFLDVEVEFINGSVESDGVRECLKVISADPLAKLTVAVCLTSTHQAIAASLYMPMEVYKNTRLQQILVYQPEAADIVLNLSNGNNDLRYQKLKPFGMVYGEYMSDRKLYLKALLVNVAYDIVNGYKVDGQKIDWPANILNKQDNYYSIACGSWKKLSVDKKWSNKYFADSISIKLRNILIGERYFSNSHLMQYLWSSSSTLLHSTISDALKKYEDALAVCEHNRWNVQQLLLGYSPCEADLDRIFEMRNEKGKRSDEVKREYIKWKSKVLNVDTRIENLGDIKDDVKASQLRIHPNLCDYRHLEKVDSGAMQYDKDLNNAILKILSVVDGHKCN